MSDSDPNEVAAAILQDSIERIEKPHDMAKMLTSLDYICMRTAATNVLNHYNQLQAKVARLQEQYQLLLLVSERQKAVVDALRKDLFGT